MIIIFVGPPGSGKGTQSDIVSKELNIPCLSTGDILRAEIKNETTLGKKAAEYVNSGKLIPSDLMNEVVATRISYDDCKKGYILDGYPRTLEQAEKLDEFLGDKKIDFVFEFKLSESDLEKRILGRYTCSACGATYNKYFKSTKEDNICDYCYASDFITRKDDDLDTLKKRLVDYRNVTQPLLSHYQGRVVELDSSQAIDEITKSILKNIKMY